MDDDVQEVSSRWFCAEVFQKVFHRYAKHGIGIHMMVRHSTDGKTDRYEYSRNQIKDPLALLHKWQEEGRCGKFFATYAVPDKLTR